MLASLALLLPLLAGADALGGDHYAPHRGNHGLVRRDVVDERRDVVDNLAKRNADPAGGDHYVPHRVKGAGSFVVGRDLNQRDADPAGGDHYAPHRAKMLGAPVVGRRDVYYVRDSYGNVLLDERGLPITTTTTVVVPMTTTNTVWVDAPTSSVEPTGNATASDTAAPSATNGTSSSVPTSAPTDVDPTSNSTETAAPTGNVSSTVEPTASANSSETSTDSLMPTISQNTNIVLPSSVSTESLTPETSGTSSTASPSTTDNSTTTAPSPSNASSSDTSSSLPTDTSSGHSASSTGWSSDDDWSSTTSTTTWLSSTASESDSYSLTSTSTESSWETDATDTTSGTKTSSSSHHRPTHTKSGTTTESGTTTDPWWSTPTTTTTDDDSETESDVHSSTQSGNHSATETGSHNSSETGSPTSTSSSHKPTSTGSHDGGMIMGGYYADWTANVIPPEEVDFSRFDVVDYAFAEPNREGKLQFTQEDSGSILKRLVSAAHSAGKKVKLSIGGWTGSAHFSPIVKSDSTRATFVQNIVDAIKQYDLDGVDIDWEYPGVEGASGNEVSPDDSDNYLVFLRELRAAVGDGILITAATQVWPFYGPDGQPMKDVSAFAEVFDYILIMNYDIWGASSKPGPNAPLNDGCHNSQQPTANAYAAVASWTAAGFPPSKLTLGLAGYGYVQRSSSDKLYQRSWDMDYPPKRRAEDVTVKNGDGGTSDGQVNFASLIAQGALSGSGSNWEGAGGFTRHWDECSSTPWLKSDASGQIITYDDPQSINLKAQFAAQAGIRGCSMWSIDGDYVKGGQWPLADAARSGMGI